jgi:hypothetical protein
MHRHIAILVLAICWSGFAGEARAQVLPPGVYGGGFAVNPYLMPPAFSSFSSYASPYGYRSFATFNAYPAPWGYNTFYNYGTFARPYSAGPFHSVYYNPFTFSYQYGPGMVNSPVFFYSYGTPFWP